MQIDNGSNGTCLKWLNCVLMLFKWVYECPEYGDGMWRKRKFNYISSMLHHNCITSLPYLCWRGKANILLCCLNNNISDSNSSSSQVTATKFGAVLQIDMTLVTVIVLTDWSYGFLKNENQTWGKNILIYIVLMFKWAWTIQTRKLQCQLKC